MAVTIEQVINYLDREEPDYMQASQLGSEALPHLLSLIKGANLGLAVKATSLAGAIKDEKSATVLNIAAQHPEPVVRVAAAAAARNLTLSANTNILLKLLNDKDVGVRKTALKSVPVDASPTLRTKIQKLITTDQENFIRDMSSQVFSRLKHHPE